MKCPNCGFSNKRASAVCAQCGAPVKAPPRTPAMQAANAVIITISVGLSVVFFSLLFYRAYYWFDAWRMDRLYLGKDMIAPSVETITMDDGQVGHAITFFGDDGDSVFLNELDESFLIVGGLTRIEIPDSNWFENAPEDLDGVKVTMTPVLHEEGGAVRPLPVLTLDVETPMSPLTLVDPPEAWAQINTSVYPLTVKVVPGSNVLVNGEDVSDTVNFEGTLTVNISVLPQGDNEISLLVDTARHKQTRQDIVLYRPYQEINLEPSLNLPKKSNLDSMAITGSIEKGATLSVDTSHVPDSITVKDNGDFSFKAKFDVVGDNQVTFRASMPGKQDSVVSVSVYYVPTLNAYSRKAWKMDYEQLRKLYDVWEGRVFLCAGPVAEVIAEGETQIVIMDVGEAGTPQYVALENMSAVGTPVVGERYRAYADVLGTYFYADMNCPKLVCRYMSLSTD